MVSSDRQPCRSSIAVVILFLINVDKKNSNAIQHLQAPSTSYLLPVCAPIVMALGLLYEKLANLLRFGHRPNDLFLKAEVNTLTLGIRLYFTIWMR
jgi:hypothetical protein